MIDFGPHFKSSEFDSPDQPSSGNNMQPDFIERYKKAREIAGIPFHINSGFRTEVHNKKVGGESNSSHMGGWAADTRFNSGSEAWIILNALIKAGFNRIGIYKTFIHADCDPSKPKNVIWTK